MHPMVIHTARAMNGEQEEPCTLETGLRMATDNRSEDKSGTEDTVATEIRGGIVK